LTRSSSPQPSLPGVYDDDTTNPGPSRSSSREERGGNIGGVKGSQHEEGGTERTASDGEGVLGGPPAFASLPPGERGHDDGPRRSDAGRNDDDGGAVVIPAASIIEGPGMQKPRRLSFIEAARVVGVKTTENLVEGTAEAIDFAARVLPGLKTAEQRRVDAETLARNGGKRDTFWETLQGVDTKPIGAPERTASIKPFQQWKRNFSVRRTMSRNDRATAKDQAQHVRDRRAKGAKRGGLILAGEKRVAKKRKEAAARERDVERKCAVPVVALRTSRDRLCYLVLLVVVLSFATLVAGSFVLDMREGRDGVPPRYACAPCYKTLEDTDTGEIVPTSCGKEYFLQSTDPAVRADRGTCRNYDGRRTHYLVDRALHVAAALPNECWGVRDPDDVQKWIPSELVYGITTQPVRPGVFTGVPGEGGFDAEKQCALVASPYTALVANGKWSKLIIPAASIPMVSLAFLTIFTYFPYLTFDAVGVSSALCLIVAIAISAWLQPIWCILWSLLFLVFVIWYAMQRPVAKMCAAIEISIANASGPTLTLAILACGVASTAVAVAWTIAGARVGGRFTAWYDAALGVCAVWIVGYLYNTLLVTGSQVTGYWYYRHVNVHKGVGRGMKRALTINAGSVFLGTAFAGLSKIFMGLAGFFRTRLSLMLQLFAAVVSLLDALLRPFNTFGFSYLVFANNSYVSACGEALAALDSTSVRLIVPDAVTTYLSFAGSIIGFVAAAGLTAAVLHFAPDAEISPGEGCGTPSLALVEVNFFERCPPPVAPATGQPLIGGDLASLAPPRGGLLNYGYLPLCLCALVAGVLPLAVVEGGVLMVYLCFAEDPTVLQGTDGDYYDDLIDEWQLAIDERQQALDGQREAARQHLAGVKDKKKKGAASVDSQSELSDSDDFDDDMVEDDDLELYAQGRMQRWRLQLSLETRGVERVERGNAALSLFHRPAPPPPYTAAGREYAERERRKRLDEIQRAQGPTVNDRAADRRQREIQKLAASQAMTGAATPAHPHARPMAQPAPDAADEQNRSGLRSVQ